MSKKTYEDVKLVGTSLPQTLGMRTEYCLEVWLCKRTNLETELPPTQAARSEASQPARLKSGDGLGQISLKHD